MNRIRCTVCEWTGIPAEAAKVTDQGPRCPMCTEATTDLSPPHPDHNRPAPEHQPIPEEPA